MENIILGYEVGEICNRDGCKGTIEEEERRPCYCHAGNPPCSACTDPRVYCEECGWNLRDQLIEEDRKRYKKEKEDTEFYKTVPERLRKLFGYYI